ncbi:MAG TPA: prepilin-type N-terminal cleavage/methylation domain-containing protein [Candidatus Acidoferrum sp.]|nr:prepilin-type N-terminal cleavage/methylation domain-containing protein [Candidatus Acidoferrum sp.]
MNAKRGFTLLETLIAVALLAIIVVSILSAFSATTLAATRHAQLTSLDRLTRSDAEYIKSQAYSTTGTYTNLTAAGFTFSYQVKYYDPVLKTFTAATDNGLQEIILTVSGSNSAREQLDFLKVQP